MSFNGYDLPTQDYDDVVDIAEKALGVPFDRDARVYGTSGSTVGMPTAAGTWVRLAWRPEGDINGPAWTGTEWASALVGVGMPALHRSHRWVDRARDAVWRADEFDLVRAPSVEAGGVLRDDPQLPDTWWARLRSSLTTLAGHPTERVGMRQDHLTRRIDQVFGDLHIDSTIDEWATAHADLHWGNVTAPTFALLDWEDWGAAPRGHDAATLWGHSLCVPSVADRIQREFAADVDSRSGRLAQLLFCANVIRLAAGRAVPSPLLGPVRQEAERLVARLRTR